MKCHTCGAEFEGYCRPCARREYMLDLMRRTRAERLRAEAQLACLLDEPQIGPDTKHCQPMGYAGCPTLSMPGWSTEAEMFNAMCRKKAQR